MKSNGDKIILRKKNRKKTPYFWAAYGLTVSMETRKFKIQNGGKNNDLKAKLILLL